MAEQVRRHDLTAPSLDEMAGVLALTLIQSVTILKGAADLLDGRWHELNDARRAELTDMLRRHADHVAQLVEDFRDHPGLVIDLSGSSETLPE